jgi:hypothetical protein
MNFKQVASIMISQFALAFFNVVVQFTLPTLNLDDGGLKWSLGICSVINAVLFFVLEFRLSEGMIAVLIFTWLLVIYAGVTEKKKMNEKVDALESEAKRKRKNRKTELETLKTENMLLRFRLNEIEPSGNQNLRIANK